MQIESIEISKLNLDPSNARKHPTKNINAIKGSLAKFGQQKPIVVDKNNVVIAGNGTLEAAKALGWSKINMVKTSLTGTEAIAFALADNRTSEIAEWDWDILSKTLEGLKNENFDTTLIGFLEQTELPDLGAEINETAADDLKAIECPECGHKFVE